LKRKSQEEVALLGWVPEDGDAMEFHSTLVSQTVIRQGDVQQDVESDGQEQASPAPTGSTPRYLDGQPLNIDEEDEEDEEQWILDEELARQGLYRGTSLKSLITPCIYQ
jgi:hypothetical protein